MSEAPGETNAAQAAPVRIALRPLQGSAAEPWSVALESDLLWLHAPDGRVVMMLAREDAARHLRFDWNVPRGRVVSFVVVEGLKAHRFRCGRRELGVLLDWLPQKPREAMEREVRLYGAAIVLTGVLQISLPEYFPGLWGLAFVLLGLAAMFYAKRPMYAANSLLMLAAGGVLLFSRRHVHAAAGLQVDLKQVLPTGLGSVLLMWGVQQFALLGANHRLRVARLRGAESLLGERSPSPAVKRVRWAVMILAALLVGQVLGLFLQRYVGTSAPILRDWVLCLTLAGVALGAVGVLRWREEAAYLEARIAGQFAVVLGVLYCAGLFNVPIENSLPFPPDILWIGLFSLRQPYVWLPLIGLVLLFNRWFGRAVEKELEGAREQREF